MRVYSEEPHHVYLYEDQEDALEALAQQRGVPMTELIRQGVDSLLVGASQDRSPQVIYLREDQINKLQALAQSWHVPRQDLVQQSVDSLLTSPAALAEHTSEEVPLEDDPLWGVVGLGRSGFSDVSVNHDQHLAQILYEESHPCPEKSS